MEVGLKRITRILIHPNQQCDYIPAIVAAMVLAMVTTI